MTREGIPVRCWVFPGDASDQNLVRRVKEDLTTWKLAPVVMGEDKAFNSGENRRIQERSRPQIIGEKMR